MTLEGWVPQIGEYLTLAEVIDLAFDYRGNVTVAKVDGAEVEGYIFNRNADVPEPFIQMFDLAGNGPSPPFIALSTDDLRRTSRLKADVVDRPPRAVCSCLNL